MSKQYCVIWGECVIRNTNQRCGKSKKCFVTPEIRNRQFLDSLDDKDMEIKEEEGRYLLMYKNGNKILYFDQVRDFGMLTCLRMAIDRTKYIIDRI